MKEGDELYSVAGQTIRGLTIGQLARLVLGPEGTTVDLELKRGGQHCKVGALRVRGILADVVELLHFVYNV